MRAYVINLEHATERRAHILEQVRDLDFELVAAVDGRTLDPDEWAMSPNETACALSHLRAYEAIARSGEPGLVVEDDAILPRPLPELELEPGDVALLYYRVHAGIRECRLVGTGPLLEPQAPVSCTAAYVITPLACERLLEFDPPRRGIGADDWQHFPVRTLCVAGRPASVRLDFPSSIGYARGALVPHWLRTWNRRRLERQMSRFVHVDRA